MFTIEVEGLEELLAALKQAEADITEEMRMTMERATAIGQDYLAKYPARIPGSTYRRTGKLGQAWTTNINITGPDVIGVIGNIRPYAPYVQDAKRQAKVHRSRWQTIQSVGEGAVYDRIVSEFEDAILKVARRIDAQAKAG